MVASPLRVPFVPESVQTHPGEVLLVTSVFLTISPLYQVPNEGAEVPNIVEFVYSFPDTIIALS